MEYLTGCRRSQPHKLAATGKVADHPVVAARLESHRVGASPLPASVDLGPYEPTRLDQGTTATAGTGTCYAHAFAAAVYTAAGARGAGLGWVPSPLTLQAATRGLERAASHPGDLLPKLADCPEGAELADVVTVGNRYGVRPIGVLVNGRNSDVNTMNVNVEPDFGELEASGKRLVMGPYTVDATDAGLSDTVAAALAMRAPAPLLIAFFADRAFSMLQPGDVMGAPDESDPGGSGHAVYIVGYRTLSNGKRIFIVSNSWGAPWCDNGRCWVNEDFLKAIWEGWLMDVTIDATELLEQVAVR